MPAARTMHRTSRVTVILLALTALFLPINTARSAAADPLEKRFRDTVQPFLQAYCLSCHGSVKPKSGLDLSAFKSIDGVAKDFRRVETVLEQLKAATMPPEKAKQQPTEAERTDIVAWI